MGKLTHSKPVGSHWGESSNQNGRTRHRGGRQDDVVQFLVGGVSEQLRDPPTLLLHQSLQTEQVSVKPLTCVNDKNLYMYDMLVCIKSLIYFQMVFIKDLVKSHTIK